MNNRRNNKRNFSNDRNRNNRNRNDNDRSRNRYNNDRDDNDRNRNRNDRDENNRSRNRYNNNRKNFKPKNHSEKTEIEETTSNEPIRLNKYIANSGLCSRRQADEYIKAGHISINGEVVTDLGIKVKPTDKVFYKGNILKGEKNVYYILNKPKNFISTLSDPQNRFTVMKFFKGKVKERIYPVGRLDRNTTGVLLFTNDGDITKKLTHPSSNITKKYVVTLDKDVTKNHMVEMAEGIKLDDGDINVDAVYYFSDNHKNKVVVEIHSGRNRIVRRIFEHFGYDISTLDRVEFAGLTKKNLMRGQWRELSEKEIGFLKMLSGKIKNTSRK